MCASRVAASEAAALVQLKISGTPFSVFGGPQFRSSNVASQPGILGSWGGEGRQLQNGKCGYPRISMDSPGVQGWQRMSMLSIKSVGLLWHFFGVTFTSLSCHFGVSLASLRDHSVCRHFGLSLGCLWYHVEIGIGSLCTLVSV